MRDCGIVNHPEGDQCKMAIEGCENSELYTDFQKLNPGYNVECKCNLCTTNGCNGEDSKLSNTTSQIFSSKIIICILLLASIMNLL
jgi:hypothetical protein